MNTTDPPPNPNVYSPKTLRRILIGLAIGAVVVVGLILTNKTDSPASSGPEPKEVAVVDTIAPDTLPTDTADPFAEWGAGAQQTPDDVWNQCANAAAAVFWKENPSYAGDKRAASSAVISYCGLRPLPQ